MVLAASLVIAAAGILFGVWLGVWLNRRLRLEDFGPSGPLLRVFLFCIALTVGMAPAQVALYLLTSR